MNFRAVLSAFTMALFALSGCDTVGEALNIAPPAPLSITEQASLSVGMDYQTALSSISASGKAKAPKTVAAPTVIAPSDTDKVSAPSLPPAPFGNSFGTRIGQFYLADDYVVYRHALAQAAINSGVMVDAVTGETVPLESDASVAATQVNLTYFLVSPKGKIEDYATGNLSVTTTACLQIISNAVVICDQPDRLSEDFALFDDAMRTSKFQPLSAWNISENAVIEPTSVDEPMAQPQ